FEAAQESDPVPPLPPGQATTLPPMREESCPVIDDELHGPVSSAIFVGRESELAALEVQSGVVLIAGDAGVGKSRLVSEVERRAGGAGKLVLVGECFELPEGELRYGPIVAALRRALQEPDLRESLTEGDRVELARLWPELAPADVVAGRNGSTSSQDRVFAL